LKTEEAAMISEEYILKLVKEYAASPEGRAAIKKQYGIELTDTHMTKAQMTAYARKMKQILYEHVHSEIKSISPEDIIIGEPVQDSSGQARINISFRQDALFRESLDPDEYPEGIEDIVLHFAHGWHAKKHIYGLWRRPSYNGGYYAQVRSRKDREPSPFLQNAVNEFNSSANGCAVAELNEEYK
jgi:hypothetical protein